MQLSCTHSVLWQVVGQDDGATVPVEFTYSVKWKETEVTFDKRMDKYRRYQFLPQHLEVRLIGVTVPERCTNNCRTLLPLCWQVFWILPTLVVVVSGPFEVIVTS